MHISKTDADANIFSVEELVSHIGIQARGLRDCSPEFGKAIILGAKAKVFGRSHQRKMKNIYIFVLIKRKMAFSVMKCLKSGIFTNIYWVG